MLCMNAVNEECHGRGEEDEFVIHKRELSQTPEALAAVGDCRRPKSKSTRKGLDSPWKSSWEVWVKDMYLYDLSSIPLPQSLKRGNLENGLQKELMKITKGG